MKNIFLLITLLLLVSCSQNDPSLEQPPEETPNENSQTEDTNNDNDQEDPEQKENNNQSDEQESTIKPLTKDDAKEILNQYKSSFMKIVESTDEKGKVKDMNSKSDYISYATTIMSENPAEWYADTYFREENGELFLKAMDAPTWFVNDQPFNLKKNNEKEYYLIQERNNELLGHVNMIYILTFQEEEDKWIVNRIEMERLDTNSNTNGAVINIMKN